MCSKPLNSASLTDKSNLIDLAIESIQSRGGAEPPKGPRPVQDASNDVTVAILKTAIEWTQDNADLARAAIALAEQSLRESTYLAVRLKMQEEKLADKLFNHARAIGMSTDRVTALMHEVNADCDQDDCLDCARKYRGAK